MKFENHEICEVLMISYVEIVVKNWECFEHLDTYVVWNRIISREVSKNLN
jgi:hypothetical protein